MRWAKLIAVAALLGFLLWFVARLSGPPPRKGPPVPHLRPVTSSHLLAPQASTTSPSIRGPRKRHGARRGKGIEAGQPRSMEQSETGRVGRLLGLCGPRFRVTDACGVGDVGLTTDLEEAFKHWPGRASTNWKTSLQVRRRAELRWPL